MIDTATLRAWLYDRTKARFKLAYGGEVRARSCFGGQYDVCSFQAVMPAGATIQQVATQLERLTEVLLDGFHVEKPGGVLVLRGDEPGIGLPSGIAVEVTDLGSAQRLRLAVHAHPTTLENARAQLRTLTAAAL